MFRSILSYSRHNIILKNKSTVGRGYGVKLSSLKRMKAGYAIVVGIGVLFMMLGVSSMIYFFAAKQVMGHSTSIYGNYFVAALICLVFSIAVLRISIPAFIPFKKNNLPTSRICPYCEAIVDEDRSFCKKCNQKLD